MEKLSKWKETQNRESQTIDLKIKTMDEKVFKFQIPVWNTINQLKLKMKDIIGLPVENQKLLYKGRLLDNNQTITQSEIEQGHTLLLVARVVIPPTEDPPNLEVEENSNFLNLI